MHLLDLKLFCDYFLFFLFSVGKMFAFQSWVFVFLFFVLMFIVVLLFIPFGRKTEVAEKSRCEMNRGDEKFLNPLSL